MFGSNSDEREPSEIDLCECDHFYAVHVLGTTCRFRQEKQTNDGKLVVRCDCKFFVWNKTNVKKSMRDPFTTPISLTSEQGEVDWLCRCGVAWNPGDDVKRAPSAAPVGRPGKRLVAPEE